MIAPVVERRLGALPASAEFLRRLDLAGIIDELCPVRDIEHVTHGQVSEVLVANRLSGPAPLVQVGDWAREWAVEEVFGIEPTCSTTTGSAGHWTPSRRRSSSSGRAKRRTRARMECTVRGLPGRLGREAAAWRRAPRSRCQRSAVSGRTNSRTRRSTSIGGRFSNAARNARSLVVKRTFSLPSWRRRTVIW
ncbi:DUF4277 domain-containing protein [Streptomyces mirabilis]|uniref:DUF4277 domain-containing protein n=1 Tax=Streptomyces mirabilis TaxID=68239 RepID=UPI00362D4667